jgi:hypothetical protein
MSLKTAVKWLAAFIVAAALVDAHDWIDRLERKVTEAHSIAGEADGTAEQVRRELEDLKSR